jgi:hypothetical protein
MNAKHPRDLAKQSLIYGYVRKARLQTIYCLKPGQKFRGPSTATQRWSSLDRIWPLVALFFVRSNIRANQGNSPNMHSSRSRYVSSHVYNIMYNLNDTMTHIHLPSPTSPSSSYITIPTVFHDILSVSSTAFKAA